MKLSQIRPCDNCGGKISPTFYLLRYSIALFKPQTRQVLAMTDYFQGNLQLGEMFSGDDDVVLITMDNDKKLMTEVFLCQECYMMKDINLAILAEKIHSKLDDE